MQDGVSETDRGFSRYFCFTLWHSSKIDWPSAQPESTGFWGWRNRTLLSDLTVREDMQCAAQGKPWFPRTCLGQMPLCLLISSRGTLTHGLRMVVRVGRRSASETCEGCLKELRLFNLKMRLRGAVTAVSQWWKGCHEHKGNRLILMTPEVWSKSISKVTEMKQISAHCRKLSNTSVNQQWSVRC